MMLYSGGLRDVLAFTADGGDAGEYVIIIHPSARDWKLFMYENNDVRRKAKLCWKELQNKSTTFTTGMHP